MKYETPELTALTTAINAIQGAGKPIDGESDGPEFREVTGAYQDWE
jgi:hypothetical protein